VPIVSEDRSHISFTPDEVRAFKAVSASHKDARLNELIIAHARTHGGEVLAVWEALDGPLFDKTEKWSPKHIAPHLGISQARVDFIITETLQAAHAQWKSE
jgi:hypothetical protein